MGCLQAPSIKVTSIWQSFRAPGDVVAWADSVWNSLAIPKCSFTLWLALRNRLLTRDRMIMFGMTTDPKCLLCSQGMESVQHLFSSCPYFDLIRMALPYDFVHDWSVIQNGQLCVSSLTSKHKEIASLFIAIAVNLVWKERNFRMHNSGPGHSSTRIIHDIKRMAREKLFTCGKFKQWVRLEPSLATMLF